MRRKDDKNNSVVVKHCKILHNYPETELYNHFNSIESYAGVRPPPKCPCP